MAVMLDQSRRPSDVLLGLVTNFRLSRAVWCAAHFRLADAIGAEPSTAEEVAAATGMHPESLRRLLDALAATGLFRSEGEGVYGPTAMSDLLRSDHPRSLRSYVEVMLGGEFYEAWGALETSLRTGQTAFDARFGMSTFEYFTAHPEAGRSFAEAMSGTTHASDDAILAADAFPDFTLAIDVGGSQGSLLRRLLEGNPDATEIVFDLPGVIAGWSVTDDDPLARRISGVGGDFFESVPSGGDLYLLKLILHDWDDARCVEILRRVRDAIKPGGHVVIVESILPATNEPDVGWLRDMNMMVITGGRERTEQAFAQLLDQAGFQLGRVVPTTSHFSVITATASDGETAGA